MLVRGQSEDEDEKRKVLSSTVKMEGPKLAAKRKGKEGKEVCRKLIIYWCQIIITMHKSFE
jgi:hypothetical protein